MDTKHPNLVHVSLSSLPAWLSPGHAGNLRRVCEQVRRRCGVEGYIDIFKKELLWGRHHDGDPAIAFSWPIFRHFHSDTPNRFEESNGLDISVDDICYVIQLARVSPERKDYWRRDKQMRRESAQHQRMSKIVHEGIRDAGKDMEFRGRRPVSA